MLKQLKDQVLDLLDKAIMEPAEPAKLPKVTSISVSNARIVDLETQLGVAHRLPIFNGLKAASRIAQLETLLAQKNVVALPATAPAAPAVQLAENADAILASAAVLKTTPTVAAKAVATLTLPPDVRPLASYLALNRDDRRLFCQDGLRLALPDFARMNPSQKMAYVRDGGQVMADARRHSSTLAASFGKS